MILIKETSSKCTTSDDRKTLRKHGIFECSVCKTHVEKPLSHGKRNKTCGENSCRKAAFSFNHNADHKNKKVDPISKRPYYDNLRKLLTYLKAHKVMPADQTIKKFYEIYITLYSDACALSPNKSSITFVKEDGSIGFIPSGAVSIDTSVLIRYNCSRLNSKEISFTYGIKHDTIIRATKRLVDNGVIIASHLNIVTNTIGATPAKGWEYNSEDDYNKTITALQFVASRNKADKIYLIKGAGLLKIGVTHDMDKRFKGITTMSPVPLVLHYSKKVTNARKLEKALHLKYKEFNSHGEWFNLTDKQIDDILITITDYL